MKSLSLTASCGHPVALECPGSTPVGEVQRRTALIESEVCLDCWTLLYLADALVASKGIGLPTLEAPGSMVRAAGMRARHALFQPTALRIGHLQQHADQAEWQRLAACLVALRRETSASRWAAWRWLEPDILIQSVLTFPLSQPQEMGGWGECPDVTIPTWAPLSFNYRSLRARIGKGDE